MDLRSHQSLAHAAAGSCSRLTRTDRLLMSWMAYAGLVHLLVEGYLVVTPGFYTKQNPNLIDELQVS